MTKSAELALRLAPLADELGELEAELSPFKMKIARAESLRRVLREAYADLPPAGSYQVHGTRYSALIGPMGAQSIVNTARLYELLGPEKFLDLASVTLRAVEGRCAPEIRGQVVSTEFRGARSLAVIPVSPGVSKRPAKKAA